MLGVLAMEAVISWCHVEEFMLQMHVRLLGGEDEAATVAYLSLEGDGPKIAMLKSVAKFRLEPRYFDLFNAVLSLVKSAKKNRDKLVHWAWGYSPDLPDAYLLSDPRKNVHSTNTDYVYVYSSNDFEDIVRTNDRLCGYGQLFGWICDGHISNKDDELYHELCAEAEIRCRLSRKDKTTS